VSAPVPFHPGHGGRRSLPTRRSSDLAFGRGEQAVLLHERGDVPLRLADRHDEARVGEELAQVGQTRDVVVALGEIARPAAQRQEDRKSTRLNSSHVKISYAVSCLKKK